MLSESFKRNAGQVYLSLVPFVATLLAFVTGHVSYKIYLPVWMLNVCLMIVAAWYLGAHVIKRKDKENRNLAIVACILIAPTLFTSLIAGLGVPPETVSEWVTTGTEQQLRFSLLIISGILIGLGFILLREIIKKTAGNFLAQLGFGAIVIVVPILIFNMAFWHSFALEAYKIKLSSENGKTLEWFSAFRNLVWILSVVEVSLTYFAIIAFVSALKAAGWFRKSTSLIYILISSIAIVSIFLSPLYPGTVIFSGFPYYPFMIPAIPFFLIHFIGVNLLRKAGSMQV